MARQARAVPRRCRSCGARYAEDAGDPCPGLCAPCLETQLRRALDGATADRWERGLTVRACLDQNDRRLREIGLTPLARERWRRNAEALLTEELAAEGRGS